MQDYRHFEPDALAMDASFQRWQLTNDPVDRAFWTDWLRQNPDKKELVEKATYILTTLNGAYEHRFRENAQLSDQEVQAEIRQLHHAIQQTSDNRVRWFRFTPVRYGMAASLLVLLSLFGWYTFRTIHSNQPATYEELMTSAAGSLPEVINTTNQPLRIDLPDRSTVLLYPKSRVSYDKRFLGPKREIYLFGKAHFNVTKNPAKPFYVYANSLVTKVLGTSFTVQAYEGAKQVKVVVRTGRVSVFAPNRGAIVNPKETGQSEGVVLTPNQQVVFSPTETRLVKSVVEQPVLLNQSVQEQAFIFKRTPITDVFAALGQSYGIQIIFDEALMRNCYLTASLSDESLFEKLDLICRTVNANYEQVDGSIVISSKGCNE